MVEPPSESKSNHLLPGLLVLAIVLLIALVAGIAFVVTQRYRASTELQATQFAEAALTTQRAIDATATAVVVRQSTSQYAEEQAQAQQTAAVYAQVTAQAIDATAQAHATQVQATATQGEAVAEARAQAVAALNDLQSGNIVEGYEAAIRAYHAAQIDQSIQALFSALNYPVDGRLLQGSPEIFDVSFSPDSGRFVSSQRSGSTVWDTETGQLLLSIPAQEGYSYRAIFSPDGTQIAQASPSEFAVYIRDAETGAVVQTLNSGETWQMVFSPDGAFIVLGTSSGTTLWDVKSGTMLATLSTDRNNFPTIVFTLDSTRLEVIEYGSVTIWDVNSGKDITSFDVQSGVYAASPDFRFIIAQTSVSGDESRSKIVVSDGGSGRKLTDWEVPAPMSFIPPSISPDQKLVLAASQSEVYIFDLTSSQQIAILIGHTALITSAQFTADSGRVITTSDDGTARIWNSLTGEQLAVLRGPQEGDGINSAEVSPDGTYLVIHTRDQQTTLWTISNPLQIRVLDLQAKFEDYAVPAISPDGTQLAVLHSGLATSVDVWNVESEELLFLLEGHETPINSVQYSPDGQRIVTASNDGTARVWDAHTGEQYLVLRGRSFGLRTAQYNADGTRIMTVVETNGGLKIWDSQTGEQLLPSMLSDDYIINGQFSPDGKLILAQGIGNAWLIDAITGQEIRAIQQDNMRFLSFVFSPDNSQLLEIGTGLVIEPINGKTLFEIQPPVSLAQYSFDGSKIIVGSNAPDARIVDAKTGQTLLHLEGHTGSILSVAFSSDGTRVATASEDGTARIWDAVTGLELAKFRGHHGPVRFVQFTPDGRRLVTASDDGSVRIWWVDPDQALLLAQELLQNTSQ